MCAEENIAATAFLIADRGRAAMLMVLTDGRARSAGELADAAGITAQTASSHLGKLLSGALVSVEVQGRHRYYRLAGPRVAHMLEALAAIGEPGPPGKRTISLRTKQLRFARCCYDHLAGRIAVAMTDGMLDRGFLTPVTGQHYAVSESGADWFGRLGIKVGALTARRWGLARQCMDWSEGQPHLAGPLGVEFMRRLCADGWLRRLKSSRAVEVTPKGWLALRAQLGIAEQSIAR
jgi:DNA-binding transcriptional ArsR family regulator